MFCRCDTSFLKTCYIVSDYAEFYQGRLIVCLGKLVATAERLLQNDLQVNFFIGFFFNCNFFFFCICFRIVVGKLKFNV